MLGVQKRCYSCSKKERIVNSILDKLRPRGTNASRAHALAASNVLVKSESYLVGTNEGQIQKNIQYNSNIN